MIWITPNTLASLKARAVPANDRWQTLLNAANINPADWNSGIMNYALVWLMTGDASYAQRAWSLMAQSMQSGLAQVTGDSGYQSRNYFPASAIVYDWCKPWLSPAQKQALRLDMEACADWVFPITNPSRTGAWGVDDPGNNYHAGFMTTWMTGLALLGDSPKAQGYIDEAKRRWSTMVTPYLKGAAAGGCWAEGVNYGSATSGFYLDSLLANLSSTSEDLIKSNPWFTDAVSAMLQLTNPTGTELAPLGDLGAGPLNDWHRRVLLQLSSHDARCQGWLDMTTPNRCSQKLNAFMEFLWYPG